MDNKSRLELLRESAQGNFKLVSSKIITERLELDDSTAAKIVIECCRIFGNDSTPAVKKEDLYHLLTTCIEFINQLNDDLLNGYLQSLYFIVKFFLKQKSIELVLGMKNLLIPKFMDSLKTAKSVKTYSALCNLVHNAVDDLVHFKSFDGRVFCEFCMMSIQMKSMLLPTTVSLATTVYMYLKTPNFSKADTNLQYNFYLSALELIKAAKKTEGSKDLDVYSVIIKILQVVIENLFKQDEFDKIKECIKITSEIAKLWDMEIYTKLFNILYHSSQLVVKLEESQESSGLSANSFESCFEDLKYLSNKYDLTTELHKTCDLLRIIFSNLLEYYANVSPIIWNTYMEEQTLVAICKLLGDLGQITSQIKTKCRYCVNCKLERDLYTAIMITVPAAKLLHISLTQHTNISKSLVAHVLHYLESCCTYTTKLQERGCPHWKLAWAQVGVIIYNIAVKLFSLKQYQCCNYFFLVIKNLIQLEASTKSSVFKFDVLKTSLHCLSEMNIHTCQFKKALMFSAIQIFLYSESAEPFKIFVYAKARSKETDRKKDACLQYLTVIHVLRQNENEIKNLYPNLNLDLDITFTKKLLIGELEQYKAIWPSKVPMMAVFKELCEVADLLTLVKVLIQTWGDDMESAHNEIDKLLPEITNRFELETKEDMKDEKNVEKQLYLATLYAMQYYSQTKMARQKIADDITNTATSEELPLLPHEMPKNPNDECDLVSSYMSLKLDEHLKAFKLLSKALTLFSNCISNCTSPVITEVLKQHNLFNFIVKMAHEFRLHCDSLQAFQAWFLCLKISRLLSDSLFTLQSISFLLEEANMDSETISELLTEAKKLESKLNTLASSETWEALTTYHINKSKMFLCHQNVKAGFKEYERAVECFLKVEEEKRNELLKIRLDFLHVQYLQLPCHLQIEGHHGNPMGKFFKVLSSITSYIKDSDNGSSFAITTLFEVYQFVAHMYRWMCLPREVRCYCRNMVTFAQQLVIPLRTASFLTYLAHADLLSMRLDDCQVKLNGLCDILCLDNKQSTFSQDEVSIDNITMKEDADLSDLVDNFADIILDCPLTEYKYQGSSASPVLYIKPFKLPSFIRHLVACDCFYCVSAEYKYLVLECINLEAQLHIHRGNTAAAQDCFNGALRLYRNIIKDITFKAKITKFLSCYPLHDLKDILCEAFCSLLLNYGNSLLRADDIKKAEYLNQELLNRVSEKKYQNMFIYNEALIQKLNIVMSMLEENHRSQQTYLQVNTEIFISEDSNKVLKTPENKQSKIIFPTYHSPRPNSPPKRRLRRIKCDFSDNKSENCDYLMEPDKQTLTVPLPPQKEAKEDTNFNSSVKNVCKTPAAACSSEFVPLTIKTTKKNKLVLRDIPISSSNNKLLMNNNKNNSADEDSSDVIPGTPESVTPFALQCRTKLLTRKLKKSTNKNLDVDADGENNKNSKQLRDNVCKNLLNELCDAENNVGKKPTNRKKTVRSKAGTEVIARGNIHRTRATSKTTCK